MHNNPSKAQSEKKVGHDEWGKVLRRIHPIVARASGAACRVFLALQSYADSVGYCWPLIMTLQKFTGIKRRDTITGALKELETLGILDRTCLVSKRSGGRAPDLFRIGGKVEKLPLNAALRFALGQRRTKKSSISKHLKRGRHPEKRGDGNLHDRVPDTPKNMVGRHPKKRGTELLYKELPQVPSVLEKEKVLVGAFRSRGGDSTSETFSDSQKQNKKLSNGISPHSVWDFLGIRKTQFDIQLQRLFEGLFNTKANQSLEEFLTACMDVIQVQGKKIPASLVVRAREVRSKAKNNKTGRSSIEPFPDLPPIPEEIYGAK